MDSRICQTISASPAKPGGLLLALALISYIFVEKAVYFAGRIVILSFVFIYIPGGSFIFNISTGPVARS
jgi:hypothetical protein